MDYTKTGNKLWLYQKSIFTCVSRFCHCYSIQHQQTHFECIFYQVKLQIYPFLSLCVIKYTIIAFKLSKISEGKKNPPNISHNLFKIILIIFLMYVLSSVCFMTCTVYFYSGLSPLDLFSCRLIIKVSRGKLQCRFYCVFCTYSPVQWWKAELSQGEYGKSQGKVVLHWDFGGSDHFSLISPVGFFYLCLCVLLGWKFFLLPFPMSW